MAEVENVADVAGIVSPAERNPLALQLTIKAGMGAAQEVEDNEDNGDGSIFTDSKAIKIEPSPLSLSREEEMSVGAKGLDGDAATELTELANYIKMKLNINILVRVEDETVLATDNFALIRIGETGGHAVDKITVIAEGATDDVDLNSLFDILREFLASTSHKTCNRCEDEVK
jgi:hypothetical protein